MATRDRRVRAIYTDVKAFENADAFGVLLGFRPETARFDTDRIECEAQLGPGNCVETVEGIGRVARILRAARLATPSDPTEWIGRTADVETLLGRAIGTALQLEVRPRTRLRFTAWLEDGIQVIDDVAEVTETPEGFSVRRRSGRFPVLVARKGLARQQTESIRWYEILSIERAP